MQAPTINTPFPEPGVAARDHAAHVLDALRTAIAARDGALPFDEYMELVLYAPGLGYYAAGARKLGPDGDFVTAPELSPLFGRALAQQLAEVAQRGAGNTLLELGPGSGALAAALLPELARLGAAPTRYLMLEPSPELRERQRTRLAMLRLPTGIAAGIEWIERLPSTPITGTLLANEVIDALPCERFVIRAGAVHELAVAERSGALALIEQPARERVVRAVRALEAALGAPFAEGYAHETCTRLPPLVATLADALDRGLLLLIDYGLGRRELYDPQRSTGTFRVHHRHRALDDALFRPGLSDLTAWVDFTAVAEAACDRGLALAGYTTQAHLLLGCGIEQFVDDADAVTRARRTGEVLRLTLPDEMGERFKAIALTRGLDNEVPLRGFALRDLAHLL